MQTAGPHEVLARDRRRYERLLLTRMAGLLTHEDAEDVVSEALLRAQIKVADDPPRRGREGPWFARIVINLGIDVLRARDGRRREGVSPRPDVVPLTSIDEDSRDFATQDEDESEALDELASDAEREHVRALVARVIEALDPKEAELLKLRHLMGVELERKEIAAMAGLTLGEFRTRYAHAWRHFVEAVALDAPTERCARTRRLLGELEAGAASIDVSAEIDAHTLDCASCRVFTRESYRALETMPLVPVVGLAERWSARIGCWWDRSGAETTTGTGTVAAGAGLWSILGGGSSAVVVKAVAILCSATAVTVGVCAGVVAVLDGLPSQERTPHAQTKQPEPKRPNATPEPTTATTPRPRATPTATPTPPPRAERRDQPRKSTSVDTGGNAEIPASAPTDASEFSPSASSSSLDPAPAPDAGEGEFSP